MVKDFDDLVSRFGRGWKISMGIRVYDGLVHRSIVFVNMYILGGAITTAPRVSKA